MGRHTIVTGLAFGDEGKGTIVDYLARQATKPLVVRHNGGCQAAHNVVTPDGKHHTFAQFGSGTLAGAPTFLSQFTILNPANLMKEAEHLKSLGIDKPLEMLHIARSAAIITPYHIAANRMREDHRGDGRHGSCGQGIGETVESALKFPDSTIRAQDLGKKDVVAQKMAFWRAVKRTEMAALGIDVEGSAFDDDGLFDRAVAFLGNSSFIFELAWHVRPDDFLERVFDTHDVIFEGAQGVLLDEEHGFHPHTTWSKTTPRNARLLLGGREAYNLGVTRAYTTRHGAGPMPTDLGSLGHVLFPEEHNGTGRYQGEFRIGSFDFISLTYAAKSIAMEGSPLDGIALTHMDRVGDELLCSWQWRSPTGGLLHEIPLGPAWQLDVDYMKGCEADTQSVSLDKFREYVTTELQAPIVIESHGPTASDKKDLRDSG